MENKEKREKGTQNRWGKQNHRTTVVFGVFYLSGKKSPKGKPKIFCIYFLKTVMR